MNSYKPALNIKSIILRQSTINYFDSNAVLGGNSTPILAAVTFPPSAITLTLANVENAPIRSAPMQVNIEALRLDFTPLRCHMYLSHSDISPVSLWLGLGRRRSNASLARFIW